MKQVQFEIISEVSSQRFERFVSVPTKKNR